MKQTAKELPITPFLPAIETALREQSWLLLEASPGAGKSTLVPFYLSTTTDWKILVVQPRRLAATLTAQYVASLSGTNIGSDVGYHVRYDKKDSPSCRVLFVTEGMLMRYALNDPSLSRWDCVILDEFHERHLHTDVAFALLKHLQKRRAELKICIMSATLHGNQLQSALPKAYYLKIPGRAFPVALQYATKNPQDQPLDLLPNTLQAVLQNKDHGNILVFLPGTREIQHAEEKITSLLRETDISCLTLTSHSSQQATRQLFSENSDRFVILATNVAETSVTLPNITHVIDSGLAKIAQFDAANRFNLLQTKRISQDSCIQRMGRAGRTGPGTCIRLYPEQDFLNRPARIEPEFLRLDLTQTLLEVHTLFPEATTIESALPWLEKPPEEKVSAALELLTTLKLLTSDHKITALGKIVAQQTFHPRLGTCLALLQQQKISLEIALLVICILEHQGIARVNALPPVHESSDINYQLELLLKIMRNEPLSFAEQRYIATEKVQTIQHDLSRLLNGKRPIWPKELSAEMQRLIQQAILATFCDRVARTIKKASSRDELSFALCQGSAARLNRTSVCQEEELLLALILQSSPNNSEYQINLASRVERKALLQDSWPSYHEQIVTEITEQGLKHSIRKQYYGQLLLAEEKIQSQITSTKTSELVHILKQTQLSGFSDSIALTRYHLRREVLIKNNCIGKDEFPAFEGDMLELFLEACCEDHSSLKELYSYGLEALIHDQLGYQASQLLNLEAPLQFVFPNKRKTTINYEIDKDPWVGDRIQNFFGLSATPFICQKRQPLTIQLLAPSMRPVQITKDLAGFWQNTYPTVKQELQRRYPRHKWPEDPWLLAVQAPT